MLARFPKYPSTDYQVFKKNVEEVAKCFDISPAEIPSLIAKLAGVEKNILHGELSLIGPAQECLTGFNLMHKITDNVILRLENLSLDESNRVEEYLKQLCGEGIVKIKDSKKVVNHFAYMMPAAFANQQFLPKFQGAMSKLIKESPDIFAHYKVQLTTEAQMSGIDKIVEENLLRLLSLGMNLRKMETDIYVNISVSKLGSKEGSSDQVFGCVRREGFFSVPTNSVSQQHVPSNTNVLPTPRIESKEEEKSPSTSPRQGRV